jgi:hypothetical protein
MCSSYAFFNPADCAWWQDTQITLPWMILVCMHTILLLLRGRNCHHPAQFPFLVAGLDSCHRRTARYTFMEEVRVFEKNSLVWSKLN